MSREPLGPIEEDLARLLEAEQDAIPPPAALGRVWERISLSVASVGTRTGSHRDAAAAASEATPKGAGWLSSQAGYVTLAAFLAGAIVGAGIHATMRRPVPERVLYVERPAQRSEPVAPTPPMPSSSEIPPAHPASAAPVPTVPAMHASAQIASESSLSAERLVLDRARSALTAGDGARALALLDEHARRFSRPQLGEEREALAIQAMILSGRYDDARMRAARFRASAPNSLFLPAIDASLASIP